MNEQLYKKIQSKEIDTDKKGIVTIYVSAFNNKDSDGDIIQKGAFKKTITESLQRIKHLKNHDYTQLLGIPLEMVEDDFGLKVRSAMIMKKDLAKDQFAEYEFLKEHGRTVEHSIGFIVPKDKEEFSETHKANIIKEIKLYEYSSLSFLGANENTPLVDIKSIENRLSYDYTYKTLKNIEAYLDLLVKNQDPQIAINEINKTNDEDNFLNNLLKHL